MKRVILHSDINACYANIELLHRPELRGKPVAVGGDVEARHGIVLAKDEIAKKFGVKTGMALWQARDVCPKLIILPPRYELYIRFSKLIRRIYSDYTDQIESFGLDECWLDVSGSTHLFGSGEKIANEIRERVKFELGITVSIGVSWNKIFAKLGSDMKKPDAVTVITRDDYKQKVWSLPAADLLYVGPATRKKLYDRGVYTIGDLARVDPQYLHDWFGKWGHILSIFANGLDITPVMQVGEEASVKSVGNSTTTPRDLVCDQDAKIIYYMLAESIAARMREQGFQCRTVQISLRDNGLYSFERQIKLPQSTCLASELCEAAMKLLQQCYRWQKPLRSIGIRAMNLVPECAPEQLTLFEDEAERQKRERLERTVDNIRYRFGHYAINRAITTMDSTLANINPKEDHVIHPVGFFKAM